MTTTNVWNLDLPATPMDMDLETVGFGLCDLVRGEYLRRLRETLAQNLGTLIQGCFVDQEIEAYIDTCMAEMEKTAIRNCMVANLYRKGMSRMINDVIASTSNGSMHGALKAVIVNANSELQRGAGPTEEVDPAIALTDGRMDVEGSGDFSATIVENDRSANFDVASVPPVSSEAATIPAEPTAFDSQDENRIFAMAVDRYRRTGIRQRSEIPARCIDPSTMRPNIVDAVLANPVDSDRVAETYEFRRKLKELPAEVQARVDRMLDRYFRDATGAPCAFKLSEPEEREVSFKRLARLVVGRMKPYFDAGRITRTMFKALAEMITKNFTFHSYDPNEETVASTVDKFFTDNTAFICRFEDVNSHFLVHL